MSLILIFSFILHLGRPNANGVDLNRNFPSQFKNGKIGKLKKMTKKEILKLGPSDGSRNNVRNNEHIQPETKAIMKWVLENPFVLSLILHGGAAGAFFPYDDGLTDPNGTPNRSGYLSATPDNKLMEYLATVYSFNHLDMHLGKPCQTGRNKFSFKNGILNGAEWYPLSGSMNDFNYIFSNSFEVTVELTCCKKPDPSTLPLEWKKNKNSLVEYMKHAHMGVKGIVTDRRGRRVSGAEIEVMHNDKKIVATDRGEYWRLLLPGKYSIRAKSCKSGQCWTSAIKKADVRRDSVEILNFRLRKRITKY